MRRWWLRSASAWLRARPDWPPSGEGSYYGQPPAGQPTSAAPVSSRAATWVFSDYQGKAQFLWDQGQTAERVKFDPFGKPYNVGTSGVGIGSLAEMVTELQAGMRFDRDLQLYLTQGRTYDPVGGRFMNVQIGAEASGARNPYLFAGNAPASGRASGGTENGISGTVIDHGPGFTSLYVHFLNPQNAENQYFAAGMYVGGACFAVGGIGLGILWGAGALASASVYAGSTLFGTVATAAAAEGAAATTTVTAAAYVMSSAIVGTVSTAAALKTYANNPNADFSSYAVNVGLAGLSGAAPGAVLAEGLGGAIGSAFDYYRTGEMYGTGHAVGSLIGGIAGTGVSGLMEGGPLGCIAAKLAVHAGFTGAGAITGGLVTNSWEGALQGAQYGSTVGSIAAAFTKACFAAGTRLLEDETRSKPIEAFRSYEEVGDDCDRILTRDEHDPLGPLVRRRVLRRFVRTAELVALRVGGRTIETTAEHPFYVLGRGWTPAGELRPGAVLVSHDGQELSLDKIASTGRIATVYNLEVEDCHTYFVGDEAWGFSVWAHNANVYGGRPFVTDNIRGFPGTVHGGESLPILGADWLRDGASMIPGQVATKLRGRKFASFGEFREALWELVAAEPDLAKAFGKQNVALIGEGLAPYAPKVLQSGNGFANMKFNLDHINGLGEQLSVRQARSLLYDLDNIQVIGPKWNKLRG